MQLLEIASICIVGLARRRDALAPCAPPWIHPWSMYFLQISLQVEDSFIVRHSWCIKNTHEDEVWQVE